MIEFALAVYLGVGLILGILLTVIAFAVMASTTERKEVADARDRGYDDGYKDGCRKRFRDKVALERRARELDERIDELEDKIDNQVQM